VTFDQWWIVLCQGLSFHLLARTDWLNRWGYPAALLAQPAYFYACWQAQQWGMFALTAYISGMMAWGTYNRFWRKG
jgi:hypothetical protein